MKPFFFRILYFSCLLSLSQASGDTILLNDGQRHEGRIVYEDDNYCLLEVQVTEGIKDEKKFLKSEIKSITKQSPDLGEFEKVKDLAPAPDLLGVADYEARIGKLEDFIKKFPRSEKLQEVKKMSDLLKGELEMIRAGGIKFSGALVTADTYLANAYAYDQSIAVQRINREINNRNLLGSLRLFADYEAKFANGDSRNELVPKIKQVLQVYRANLTESLAGYDARMKAREVGLARMTPEEKDRTERAIAEQDISLKERFAREKAIKGFWITPDENLKESLVEAIRQVENETKRLDAPRKNSPTIKKAEDAYREAWDMLSRATAEEQKKILENLKRDRMPEHYMTLLRERATSQ